MKWLLIVIMLATTSVHGGHSFDGDAYVNIIQWTWQQDKDGRYYFRDIKMGPPAWMELLCRLDFIINKEQRKYDNVTECLYSR